MVDAPSIVDPAGADEPDLLTLDHIHQFAYCPRRAYLMHVEGLWLDNAATEDGRAVHRRVDRIQHVLPDPEPAPESSSGSAIVGEDPPTIARSVSLSCPRLGVTGRLDLVSTAGEEAVPVETKRGRVPDTPERCWEPERVQLMAQGLLLRANGFLSDHGFLYFAGSRSRVEVPFTAELEARTLQVVEQARAQAAGARLPPPLEDSPKCPGCSIAGICLPDEMQALSVVPPDPVAPKVRRLYPSRDDAMPLYVQEQGAWVGTRSGALVVKKDGTLLAEARLKDLDHLVLCGNVQVGARAVHLLSEAGIPIVHLSTGHWFHAITSGFALRNAYDRAAQFRVAEDPQACLTLARAIVTAKGENQRALLRRNLPERPAGVLEEMAKLVDSASSAPDPSTLLGIEGSLARHYFGHLPGMVKPGDLAAMFDAQGRNRRPPRDPVNSLLSFGYALLAKECTVALAAVGLDPFWGIFHRPRHGRPALALDLMEEFRPLVVDSSVLTALNTGMLGRGEFTVGKSGCILKAEGRKAFIRAYEARMEQMATHPVLGYKVCWRTMIRLQARLLARWLRGDIPAYRGVTTR